MFAPGPIQAGIIATYGGPYSTAETTWEEPPDHYAGRCEHVNGANVLMIHGVDGARHLNPFPDDTWGLHLTDLNIAMGNLQKLIATQTKAYLRSTR
jgi:hypothetical protein